MEFMFAGKVYIVKFGLLGRPLYRYKFDATAEWSDLEADATNQGLHPRFRHKLSTILRDLKVSK